MNKTVPWLAVITLLWASACVPADRQAATAQLLASSFVRIKPLSELGSNQPLATFGPGYLEQTNAVRSSQACEGVAGSVIPPMALRECAAGLIHAPFSAIQAGIKAIEPAAKSMSPYARHVELSGLERFWIPQDANNTCWAAALAIALRYLRQPTSQAEIVSSVSSECPKLRGQTEGAEAYQILIGIGKSAQRGGWANRPGFFCNEAKCIVDGIRRGRPVLVLNSSHVVLVQGVDYELYQGSVLANQYTIVDPDPKSEGKLQSKGPLELCTADAVIVM